MKICILLFICLFLVFDHNVTGITVVKECPYEETHKSCMFVEEYTCWEDKDRLKRNKSPARTLVHCWGGCVCRKGLVRAYPKGPCVSAHNCRDLNLKFSIKKLPVDFIRY